MQKVQEGQSLILVFDMTGDLWALNTLERQLGFAVFPIPQPGDCGHVAGERKGEPYGSHACLSKDTE